MLARAIVKGITTVEVARATRQTLGENTRKLLAVNETLDPTSLEAMNNREAAQGLLRDQIVIMEAVRLVPLLEAVFRHAEKNYEKGWDIVIEATEWLELCNAVGNSTTPHGAISKVAKTLAVKRNFDYSREIRNA
jgi:hypothetical protein